LRTWPWLEVPEGRLRCSALNSSARGIIQVRSSSAQRSGPTGSMT